MSIQLMRQILITLVNAEKYGLPNASIRFRLHEAICEAQKYSNHDPASCFEEA